MYIIRRDMIRRVPGRVGFNARKPKAKTECRRQMTLAPLWGSLLKISWNHRLPSSVHLHLCYESFAASITKNTAEGGESWTRTYSKDM